MKNFILTFILLSFFTESPNASPPDYDKRAEDTQQITARLQNKEPLKASEIKKLAELFEASPIVQSQIVDYLREHPKQFWDVMDVLGGDSFSDRWDTKFFLGIQNPELHQQLNIIAFKSSVQKGIPHWKVSEAHSDSDLSEFVEEFAKNQGALIGSIGSFEKLSVYFGFKFYEVLKTPLTDFFLTFPTGDKILHLQKIPGAKVKIQGCTCCHFRVSPDN